MLIIGIDDAGRGPLIGPMILAGVLVTKSQDSQYKKRNIRDSKTVLQPERIKQAEFIKENSIAHKIVQSSPNEIDNSLNTGTNLNTLEAQEAAKIINYLNSPKYRSEKINVIVDCPSVNTLAWKNTLISFIEHKDNLEFFIEHKADANHPSVSAASILAKVTREEEVAKIKKKYGDIGSGYPSDPTTKEFLKNHGKDLTNSGIFRKTWSTWKKLFPSESTQKGQATLGDF
ncbi:MAG: ribonuclease HII [Nanoarchaeota archaeon]|nr:ribonuclease HII [Nanoarchaeota archaeon]